MFSQTTQTKSGRRTGPRILGVSCYYHDSAAVLLADGEVVAAAEEERFTGLKHDASFPTNALHYVLSAGGIRPEDVDCVAFYDKPILKFERVLECALDAAPFGLGSWLSTLPDWIDHRLLVKSVARREISGLRSDVSFVFPEHHESHAAAAFFPSPFSEAAFLTIDGVGEWATTSWGTARPSELKIESEIHFPHSLGLLYSAFTHYAGFKVNSGEGKLMGLAPYGNPVYCDLIYDNLIDVREDGSFCLNMEYFSYAPGLSMTSHKFAALFPGGPRMPESALTQRDKDLARSIQDVLTDVVLRMARHVQKETGMRRLCLGGGVALNCVANGHLLRSGIFDELWVQPAPTDAGSALGAALIAHHMLGRPRDAGRVKNPQQGSLLGPSYTTDEVIDQLAPFHASYTLLESSLDAARYAARLIADGCVVGWFVGRMEFGPRALGCRSILGDPRDPNMQSLINEKIKKRESFRPFAPSVIAPDAAKFFAIDQESACMSFAVPVTDSRLPAVTHVDGTARVQTVSQESNPSFYALISAFREITGIGVVVNTSFNVRGEPIVMSPHDAYVCFMRTEMDYLILENVLIKRTDQPLLGTFTQHLRTPRDRWGIAWPRHPLLRRVALWRLVLARWIHFMVVRVLLTLVFLAVLVPTGLLARLFGRKFLVREPDTLLKTYWRSKPREEPRYDRMF